MKILLDKKLTIAFAVILFSIASVKAQIPVQLKKLPAFRLRAFMLPSSHQLNAHGALNDMRCSDNALCLKSQITLGGSDYDHGQTIISTKDGGFAVCGGTYSTDGDFHVTAGNGFDGYIAKYNKQRQLEWTKTFGGTGDDVFNSITQTWEGGYILAGQTSSNDGDVSGNHGGNDVWIIKLSATGMLQWQKCFGGTNDEFGEAIVPTISGGYAVACFTSSFDGDVTGNHNTDFNFDGWFFKVNATGNLLFQHCYGGSDFDGFFGMVPSDFGSFILEGASGSNDGDVSGNHGGGDAWVVKVNAFGKIAWQKTIGGSSGEGTGVNGITMTTDGNVVIDGYSSSVDGDINAKNDTLVSFATKLNSVTGKIIWSKSYATPSLRAGFGIFATKDGGTVEAGAVGPGFDNTTFDVLVSKFNKNGSQEWYKRLGGSSYDGTVTGYELSNGDLNILCETGSTDGDVKNNHGIVDEWIIKLGRCGNYITDNVITSTKINTTNLSAYPNPVFNSTSISFNLQQPQKISATIYDINGRLVKTLVYEQMQQGSHQLIWNARDEKGNTVNAGMYVLKLQAGNNIQTKKISVIH